MSELQIALNRLIRASHMRGMSTRLTKQSDIVDVVDTELYANVTRSESAVLAIFERERSMAQELAEALGYARDALYSQGFGCTQADAALKHYKEVRHG